MDGQRCIKLETTTSGSAVQLYTSFTPIHPSIIAHRHIFCLFGLFVCGKSCFHLLRQLQALIKSCTILFDQVLHNASLRKQPVSAVSHKAGLWTQMWQRLHRCLTGHRILTTVFHTCDRLESKYAAVLVGLPLSVMISISRGWGVVPKQKRWEKGMYTFCIRVCVLGI